MENHFEWENAVEKKDVLVGCPNKEYAHAALHIVILTKEAICDNCGAIIGTMTKDGLKVLVNGVDERIMPI